MQNSSIKFPYRSYRGFACPIIGLEVRGPMGWLEIEAYVDSGASISVFSSKEADNLGINLEKGETTYITVGDGSLIPVYIHSLDVKIGSVSLKAAIGFSPKLGVGFNLLGRKDFFTRFDITFSDSAKTIAFSPAK